MCAMTSVLVCQLGTRDARLVLIVATASFSFHRGSDAVRTRRRRIISAEFRPCRTLRGEARHRGPRDPWRGCPLPSSRTSQTTLCILMTRPRRERGSPNMFVCPERLLCATRPVLFGTAVACFRATQLSRIGQGVELPASWVRSRKNEICTVLITLLFQTLGARHSLTKSGAVAHETASNATFLLRCQVLAIG